MFSIDNAILSDELEKLIEEIRQDQAAKGLKASGESAKSLRKEVEASGAITKGSVYGRFYFYFQQNGRGPGKGKRPPRALVDAIRRWLEYKGLNLPVYAVAMKIHKRGIVVPNRFNPGGVLSDTLDFDRVRQRLGARLRDSTLKALKTELFG